MINVYKILIRILQLKRNIPLERPRPRLEDNMFMLNSVWLCRFSSSCSGRGRVAGCFEYGNIPFCSPEKREREKFLARWVSFSERVCSKECQMVNFISFPHLEDILKLPLLIFWQMSQGNKSFCQNEEVVIGYNAVLIDVNNTMESPHLAKPKLAFSLEYFRSWNYY